MGHSPTAETALTPKGCPQPIARHRVLSGPAPNFAPSYNVGPTDAGFRPRQAEAIGSGWGFCPLNPSRASREQNPPALPQLSNALALNAPEALARTNPPPIGITAPVTQKSDRSNSPPLRFPYWGVGGFGQSAVLG